jgi:hypothetical protein
VVARRRASRSAPAIRAGSKSVGASGTVVGDALVGAYRRSGGAFGAQRLQLAAEHLDAGFERSRPAVPEEDDRANDRRRDDRTNDIEEV